MAASSVAVAGCPVGTQPSTATGGRSLIALDEGEMIPLHNQIPY